MPVFVNTQNVWKKPSEMYVNAWGVWRKPVNHYINYNGVWKPIVDDGSSATTVDYSYGKPLYWGYTWDADKNTIPKYLNTSNYLKINVGLYCKTLLSTDGTIYTWGKNDYGELGNGTYDNSSTPNLNNIGGDYVNFSCGNYTTIGLKSDGTLWGWGRNQAQELGMWGANINIPTQIGTDHDWAYVDMDYYRTVAVKKNGAMYWWGENVKEDDTDDSSVTPQRIGPLDYWKSVSSGRKYTAAIKSDGTLWVVGKIDTRSTPVIPYYSTLTQLGTDSDWSFVTCGSQSIIVIKNNGSIWGLGSNYFSQLFDKNSGSWINSLTQLDTNYNWKKASIGYDHTLLSKTDNSLWSVGRNTSGQLGNGTIVKEIVPITVGNNLKSVVFSAKNSTSSALSTAHIGINDLDRLVLPDAPISSGGGTGGGSTGGGTVPSGNAGTGAVHPMLIDKNSFDDLTIGKLFAVGNNQFSSCEKYNYSFTLLGNPKADWKLIAFGAACNTYALDAEGNIYKIDSTGGGVTLFSGTGQWRYITGGQSSFFAIKEDGTLWAWGSNSGNYGSGNYRLGLGDTNFRSTPTQVGSDNKWISVQTEWTGTYALKSDGTIWNWGWGSSYGTVVGATGPLVNVSTPVQVGSDSDWAYIANINDPARAAIKTNGDVYVWGWNLYNRLGEQWSSDNSTVKMPTKRFGNDIKGIQITNYAVFWLKNNGSLWVTGNENWGSLGCGNEGTLGNPAIYTSLHRVGTDSDWAFVHSLSYATHGIKNDGTLYGTGKNNGSNNSGRIGLGTTVTPDQYDDESFDHFQLVPFPACATKVVSSEMGYRCSYVICSDTSGVGSGTYVPPSGGGSGTSNVSGYKSIYQYGQKISYCSSAACASGEDCETNSWSCTSKTEYNSVGAVNRHWINPTDYRTMYNLNDPKIKCGAENITCSPTDKSLTIDLLTIAGAGLNVVTEISSEFRLFIPPGTFHGEITIYVPQNVDKGLVVRYQQPPIYSGTYNNVTNWDAPSTVTLDVLKNRDVFLKRNGGLIDGIVTYNKNTTTGFDLNESGWIYFKVLSPTTDKVIHKVFHLNKVRTSSYMTWYNGASWDTDNDPSEGPVTGTSGGTTGGTTGGGSTPTPPAIQYAYVIGGMTNQRVSDINDCIQYNDTTNTHKHDIPLAVSDPGSFTVKGSVYAFGGMYGSNNSNKHYKLTGDYVNGSGSWSTKSNMPYSLYSMACSTVEGKGFSFSGRTTYYTAVTFAYNSDSDSWSNKSSLVNGAMAREATNISGDIYVFGGYYGYYYRSNNYKYNYSTNAFTSKRSLLSSRGDGAVETIGTSGYYAGGYGGEIDLTNMDKYTPSSDTWVAKTLMIHPRLNISASAMGTKYYVFCGEYMVGEDVYASDDVYQYSEATNAWSSKGNLIGGARGMTTATTC